MVEEALEALRGAPSHGRDRGRGDGHGEDVAHEFGEAVLGHELGVHEVAHPGCDAWPVLHRGVDARREVGSCQGAACTAEAAMGAVFCDLERLGLGYIEDLPARGRTVPVGVRQRCAAAGTGGRVVIDDMVRVVALRKRGSLVARLAAAGSAGLASLASGAPLGCALSS